MEHGCQVAAICPRGHILRHVGELRRVYRYRRMRSLASLEAAIRDCNPDWIIPCDDRVVWQLHELHRLRPDLRKLIELSLGSAEGYQIVSQRYELLAMAEGLGIRVPETLKIESEQDIQCWFRNSASPVALKLDGSWGGEGVGIAYSARQASAIYRRFIRRQGLGIAMKRVLVNHDPVSLWEWRAQKPPVVTIQQFIHGRPANAMLACLHGQLLGLVSVEVLSSQGATGASVIVRIIKNAEIERAAKLLTDKLQLNGFYGLDFMLDVDNQAWLIEMNPRCTQLGHLPVAQQGDLAGILCEALSGTAYERQQHILANDIIAFFPQAISWNANSQLFRIAYHDVPWEQPELIRELLLDIWPNRRWIARLYHAFRPTRKEAPASANLDDDLDSLPAPAGVDLTSL